MTARPKEQLGLYENWGGGGGGELLGRGWRHQDSALREPNILGGKLSLILQANSALARQPSS